jgi:methionyl-tRNA formyltransferase
VVVSIKGMNTAYNQIYHFATLEEGLEVLKTYNQDHLDLDVNIIISTYNYRSKSKYRLKNTYSLLRKKNYSRQFRSIKQSNSLKIYFVDDINSPFFIDSILPNSLAICTGFSQIFSPQLLSRFSLAINIHQSLLPFYKGPIPTYWCMKNEEKWTGFTVHKMAHKIDGGQILFQKKIPINHSNHLELQKDISFEVANCFQDLLLKILSNETNWYTQLNAMNIYLHHPDYLGFPEKA